MFNPYKNTTLYIAGPECFYERGGELLESWKNTAQWYGFNVAVPTSPQEEEKTYSDVRDEAKDIFDDLEKHRRSANCLICDLENFRGNTPDSGSMFECGWLYSSDSPCYGFSRDTRPFRQKAQGSYIKNNIVLDQTGLPVENPDLPFCVSITAALKTVQGNFEDCLKVVMTDIDAQRRGIQSKKTRHICQKMKNAAFISHPYRYSKAKPEYLQKLIKELNSKGIKTIFPEDFSDENPSEDPVVNATRQFDFNMAMIDSCQFFVADLTPYRSFETCPDTSFECGYAYGKGKAGFVFTEVKALMKDRIPSYHKDGVLYDAAGCWIEDHGYPVNLMFPCTMPLMEAEEIADAILHKTKEM